MYTFPSFLYKLSLSPLKVLKVFLTQVCVEREWSAAPPTTGLETCKNRIAQHPLDKIYIVVGNNDTIYGHK